MKENLLGLDAAGLARFFEAQGEKPFRARQVQRWIHQLGVSDFAAMSDLSKALREKIVGFKPGEGQANNGPIVGDPIGRQGLDEELAYEMIPYAPL